MSSDGKVAWHSRPSVGTWYIPLRPTKVLPEAVAPEPPSAASLSPADALALLHSEDARRLLRDAGVELDEEDGVQLEQVLERGQQLAQTPEGARLFQQAQQYALDLLAALGSSGPGRLAETSPEVSARFVERLEETESGRRSLDWGRQRLAEAKADPAATRKWFSAEALPRLGTILSTSNVDPEALLGCLRLEGIEFLRSDEVLGRFRAAGVQVDEAGNVHLEEVIAHGRELLQTEEGTLILQRVRDEVTRLLLVLHSSGDAGESEQSRLYLAKLEESEQGRALLHWGREKFTAFGGDTESVQRWLSSDGLSKLGALGEWCKFASAQEWDVRGAIAASAQNKFLEFLQSDEAKAHLTAAGVEYDEHGNVGLAQVLERSDKLMESEAGATLIRQAQEEALKLFSSLEAGTDGEAVPEQAHYYLEQLGQSAYGQQLVEWGRDQLRSGKEDPDALKKWLSADGLSQLSEWSRWSKEIVSADADRREVLMGAIRSKGLEFLRSEDARRQLLAAGVEMDEEGNVRVDQVLARGQQLMETEGGAEILRRVQEHAVVALAENQEVLEKSDKVLKHVEATEQGRQAVEWGRKQLAALKEDPDALKKMLAAVDAAQAGELAKLGGSAVANDGKAREDLLKTVKDRVTSFLIEYIPTVEVEKIEGENEGWFYTIDGIDLSSFALAKENVEIELLQPNAPDESSPAATAEADDTPEAEMPGCAADSPVVNDEAQPSTRRMSDFLADIPGGEASLVAPSSDSPPFTEDQSALPVSDRKGSADSKGSSGSGIPKLSSVKGLVPKGLRKKLAESKLGEKFEKLSDKMGEKQKTLPSVSVGAPSSPGEVLRVTTREMTIQIPKMEWTYKGKRWPNPHGEGIAYTRAQGGAVCIVLRLERQPVAGQEGKYKPSIGLASCSVTIDNIQMQVRESIFTKVYNVLLNVFQEVVKDYIAESLADALKTNMSKLLAGINEYVGPYLPILLATVQVPLDQLPLGEPEPVPEPVPEEGQAESVADDAAEDAAESATLSAVESLGVAEGRAGDQSGNAWRQVPDAQVAPIAPTAPPVAGPATASAPVPAAMHAFDPPMRSQRLLETAITAEDVAEL